MRNRIKERFQFDAEPVYPLPDDLTVEEYNIINMIKKNQPKESFSNLKYQIQARIPRLKNVSAAEIRILYDDMKKKLLFRTDPFLYFISQDGRENLIALAHNPSQYLLNNKYPFSINKKNVDWSSEEDALLKEIMNTASEPVNFPTLAICFPGRTGKQIHSHYLELLKKKEISNLKEIFPEKPFDLFMHRYFLPYTEKLIANEIIELFKCGSQITEQIIREKARTYYYLPWVLAERITYQRFMSEKKNVYIDEKKYQYTEEFIEHSVDMKEELTKLIINEKGDVDIKKTEDIIRENKLPIPAFSNQWIKSFLKRNHLSWRHGHYSRRGIVDPIYAKQFLKKLAKAVTRYGYSYVFNMDETSIRVVNSSTRTVAPIGYDQIIINSEANTKQCFTAIGTITRDAQYPLIIIAKGLTEKSCKKFNVKSGNAVVWPSKTNKAWMNEDLMIDYLQHLYDNWSKGQPCALLVDCFRAHCTKIVKKFAKEHFIELIYIPANGTSDFQPLDRRIFGIIKSKLRSLAGSRIFTGPKRYEMITDDLIKAWDDIQPENLISAWDIPKLEYLIQKIAHEEENEEEEDIDLFNEEDDIFDWETESDDDDDPDYQSRDF